MPTKIEKWMCDICLRSYGSHEQAVRCEKQCRSARSNPIWRLGGDPDLTARYGSDNGT